MARSLRSQKKQTRIAFEPLSSSSPAKSGYSSAVQDRLASVRLEGTRKARPASTTTIKDESRTLLTPAPSSQVRSVDNGPSLPLTKFYDPAASPLQLNSTTRPVSLDAATDEDEDDIPVPSSKRRRLASHADQVVIRQSASPRRPNRTSSSIQRTPDQSKQRGNRSSDTRTPRSTRSRSSCVPPINEDSDEYEGLDGRHRSLPGPPSISSPETSGDEDAFTLKRLPPRSTPAVAAVKEDPFVVDDDDIQYVSTDEEVPKQDLTWNKRRKNKVQRVNTSTDEDILSENADEGGDDDQPATTHRKKRSVQAQRKAARREKEELEEDLLDLQDSDQEYLDDLSRTRGGPVTTERDKTREHFARLRRQRAGEKAPRVIRSSDDEYEHVSDMEQGVNITDIGCERDSADSKSDGSSDLPLIGAPDIGHLSDNADVNPDYSDEEDFIVEDDAANIGRHGRPHPDIPLQFTKFASAKPKQLFIHIVEWMVKNKISPAFSRNDDVYTMSFSRIDDQVMAQAGSHLISSAWNATFKYVILARPNMKVAALPGSDEDNIRTCDACNRTNHPARYDFKFTGHPYYKDSLEPVDNEDEDGEEPEQREPTDEDRKDDDSEYQTPNASAHYDEQGHLLARESQHFYLGRFCAANAEMGHKLSHWKYHLNEKVLAYLEEQGVLSTDAVVARDKMNKKKREKEAETIVDTMQEIGEVEMLWQAFQDDLEDAKFGMEDHVRSSGRGKGRIGSVRVPKPDGRIGEWNEGGRYQVVADNPSNSEGE